MADVNIDKAGAENGVYIGEYQLFSDKMADVL